MMVVDASVLANVLADSGPAGKAARARLRTAGGLSAPDLVDVETVSVLRKRWQAGDLTEAAFRTALAQLEAMTVTRYPTLPLMRRAFDLRANVSVYDAAYVALAEGLDCPLVTADGRLAKAPGPTCEVEVLAA